MHYNLHLEMDLYGVAQMSGLEPLALTPTFRGSVNTWECDENDHQNVRFYAHKMNQAIEAWVTMYPSHPAHQRGVLPSIRSQHIRFLREARAATPVWVECGERESHGGLLKLTSIMRHSSTEEPLAAFETVLDTRSWADPWPDHPTREVPDFAQPRGLDPASLPPPPASIADAGLLGYRVVGQGVIGAEECDLEGRLLPHVYIGRVSDGMPNLWLLVNTVSDLAAREEGSMGGAALEYRLHIHEPLTRGDAYTHLSGIREVGNKTQTLAHLVFSHRTGRCAASAAAIGVSMDLVTRRAVAIPPARRARLERMLVRG